MSLPLSRPLFGEDAPELSAASMDTGPDARAALQAQREGGHGEDEDAGSTGLLGPGQLGGAAKGYRPS